MMPTSYGFWALDNRMLVGHRSSLTKQSVSASLPLSPAPPVNKSMAFFFEIADGPVLPSPTIASGANAASNPLNLTV
jgi:hypothetical protein